MSKPGLRSLEDVLRELTHERGLTLIQVVQGAHERAGTDRGTVYRVMAGSTRDPHVSTLAAICRGLDVRPQVVFERCGLWTHESPNAERRTPNADVRALWASVACLPDTERVRITQVVRAMVDAAHAQRAGQRPSS